MSLKFFTKYFATLLLAALMGSAASVTRGQSAASGTTTTSPAPATQQKAPVVATPRSTTVASAPVGARPVAAQPQPLQVITIVHRLSGWKLRTWLSLTNARVLDPAVINQFVYTNIVAGYVLGDGRSVVARLPQADAEMLSLPAESGYDPSGNGRQASPLTLVRRDGAQLSARFIGLDGSTWLTLLEADGLGVAPSRDASEDGLMVGERVRLFAPLRAQRAQAGATGNGATGAIYMRIGELKGTITEIARSSTGRVTRLTVRAEGISPQVIGGVVLNESGETVGLVETSAVGEARVIPASIVKRAAERVLQRRASVPRPLLGVRGEAVASTTVKQLEAMNWKLEEANRILTKQQGVLLTMVTPNSPAALADLRAGDIITRVNDGDVKTSEDFSYLLNEAGGGASVQFTVLRAQQAPLEVTVKLSEALNLLRATQMTLGLANSYASGATPMSEGPPRRTLENMAAPGAQQAQVAQGRAQTITMPSTLVADLDYIIIPAEQVEASNNPITMMLINTVRTGSDAEKLGLRAGDIIVSVNGQKLTKSEWPEKLLQRKASELSLVVMRGGQRMTLSTKNSDE